MWKKRAGKSSFSDNIKNHMGGRIVTDKGLSIIHSRHFSSAIPCLHIPIDICKEIEFIGHAQAIYKSRCLHSIL
ncbi:MAG: hypothetical protein M3162_08310 [Thermoproteota archaeon]|nr:hypothetical protein [Thermoproteota archaeon]